MLLDDSTLASDARAALRKLAYDFPVDVGLGESPATIIPPRERATAARLGMVGQALLRLKRVSFTYRGMTRDVTLPRTVEPYGLFFQSGHWYLAARDAVNGDLRNFRVSRMRDISVNARRAQSRDYEIPGTFRLADHAGDRSAWELGDGDPQQMVVEFRGSSGAATAALRLGSPSPLGERFRAFQVRRPDVFARWVLSFAGEAVPVSPPRFVEKCRTVARDTLTVYGDGQ
jgi:predicted DNA-binding transcriptional regulator YafY